MQGHNCVPLIFVVASFYSGMSDSKPLKGNDIDGQEDIRSAHTHPENSLMVSLNIKCKWRLFTLPLQLTMLEMVHRRFPQISEEQCLIVMNSLIKKINQKRSK